jgi:hypothetical protein
MQAFDTILHRIGQRKLARKASALLTGHPSYMLAPLTCQEVTVLRLLCGPVRVVRVALQTAPWALLGMALIVLDAPLAVLLATAITMLGAVQAWQQPAIRPCDLRLSDDEQDRQLLELTPRGRVLATALESMHRGPCLLELVWASAD